MQAMNRSEIIARLRENERPLRQRGVAHAGLFGSRARGDNRTDSDTDIMVVLAPDARISIYEYVGLKNYIAGLFDGPVDVVTRDSLKPHIRQPATSELVYAF
jgi:predicted nucleotidyltransferase